MPLPARAPELPESSLPPVTDAHRRAAFAAMRWQGWTFEAAMANDTRRRVVEARAHQLRTVEWKAQQRAGTGRAAPYAGAMATALRNSAYVAAVGRQQGRPRHPWPPTVQDLKRAASGDRMDEADDDDEGIANHPPRA